MLNNLLLKLGLIKISQDDFFVYLKRLNDDTSNMAIDKLELSKSELSKAKTEIKIFLWFLATPFLKQKMSKTFADKTMKFFRNEIVFSSINENDFDEEFIQKLLQNRMEFYDEILYGKPSALQLQDYFKTLNKIWFEKPFETIETNQPDGSIFNTSDNFYKANKASAMYFNILEGYDKSIQRLIKYTKNVA